jgi:hypothetical protein
MSAQAPAPVRAAPTPAGPFPRPLAARYAAAYVAGIALWSAIDAVLQLHRPAMAHAVHLLLGLALNLILLAWVLRDARARGRRTGAVLKAALVLAAILALPYYLLRSRQGAARKRALLAYLALLAGAYGANQAGVLLAWTLA